MASDNVTVWGDRECADGQKQPTNAGHQKQQARHEEEMVNAGQNVLDAQDKICARNLEAVRRGLYNERRRGRCKSPNLRRTIKTFNAHQNVNHSGGEPFDVNGAAREPPIALHAPTVTESIVDGRRAYLADLDAALRQPHVDAEAIDPHRAQGLSKERRTFQDPSGVIPGTPAGLHARSPLARVERTGLRLPRESSWQTRVRGSFFAVVGPLIFEGDRVVFQQRLITR